MATTQSVRSIKDGQASMDRVAAAMGMLESTEISFENTVTLPLAERGTWIGKKLWVREIRQLDKKGHQTSILSTDYRSDDSRSFVRGLMRNTVNLLPDPAVGELRIELHGQAKTIHDGVVAHLCEELNAT